MQMDSKAAALYAHDSGHAPPGKRLSWIVRELDFHSHLLIDAELGRLPDMQEHAAAADVDGGGADRLTAARVDRHVGLDRIARLFSALGLLVLHGSCSWYSESIPLLIGRGNMAHEGLRRRPQRAMDSGRYGKQTPGRAVPRGPDDG
ncbi:hypothetical protein SBA4_2270014 [Candidatus Sulfopaludibacter sp. SbA4]|nr:hypothetical protein SBA4_2270014 [Candidatus Sulfopaludibacter sp. SbA4]